MAATWLLGASIALGVALGSLLLAGRRPPGAQAAGWIHGAAATIGTVLVLVALSGGAADDKASGRLAACFLAAALALGTIALVAQLRGRRASGLAVTLHAVMGLGGFLLLLLWGGA